MPQISVIYLTLTPFFPLKDKAWLNSYFECKIFIFYVNSPVFTYQHDLSFILLCQILFQTLLCGGIPHIRRLLSCYRGKSSFHGVMVKEGNFNGGKEGKGSSIRLGGKRLQYFSSSQHFTALTVSKRRDVNFSQKRGEFYKMVSES